MDHLPKPHSLSTLSPKLVFPLRCDPNRHDNGPLETYPERRGFRLNYWGELKFANILSLPDGSRPSAEQSTKLLQEWLFFGLLSATHSTYGTKFNGYDYVRIHGGINVLSLKNLLQQFNTWFDLEGEKPKAERKQHFHEIERHLMRSLRFLTNNFTANTHGSLSVSGALDNVVSEESRIHVESNLEILLLVLLEAIEYINKTVYFRGRKEWGSSGADVVCLSTQQLMKSPYWCPSELNFMGLTFDNTCKGCKNIHIDLAELESTLTSSDHSVVPRVKISVTEQDMVQICLVNDGDYVAISHVWSDGLGHPPGLNALPECQIRRLCRLVLETGLKDSIVWIDALCIPAKDGPGKRSALARMAGVYRNATNVLVLDSDLLSTPSTCCNEELLLRIALSKWFRRLWTLEEGVVARSRLLFQFSDQSIPLPAPHMSSSDNIALNCTNLISQYLPTDADILSVITALHFRSTSWSADEPLCIGYIVGIDVSTIISITDVQARMLELYRLLSKKDSKFPWQFLFTDEEKLTVSPFRWAPASLLNLEPHDVFYVQGMQENVDNGVLATQTDRGLRFQCKHSCLLRFAEGANIKMCMILRIDALSYVLCPVPKGGKCRSHARFWEGVDKEKCLAADPARDWTETWQGQYDFRPTGNWGLICTQGGGSYGVMVAIDDFKDKTLYGTIIGQVQMYELQTEYSSIVSVNKEYWGQLGLPELDEGKVRREQERAEREAFDEGNCSIVDCVMRLPEEAIWCIG